MSIELHKAIIKRSRLRDIFLKHRTYTNKKNDITQRNFCKKLLKNTKKSYFENLNTKKITDNRSFWRTVLSLFTKIHQKVKKITLVVILKPYLVKRSSVRHLFHFPFLRNVVFTLNIPKPKSLKPATYNVCY